MTESSFPEEALPLEGQEKSSPNLKTTSKATVTYSHLSGSSLLGILLLTSLWPWIKIQSVSVSLSWPINIRPEALASLAAFSNPNTPLSASGFIRENKSVSQRYMAESYGKAFRAEYSDANSAPYSVLRNWGSWLMEHPRRACQSPNIQKWVWFLGHKVCEPGIS